MSKISHYLDNQQFLTLAHQQILEKISSLTDLQVRMLMCEILEEEKAPDESKIDLALIEERESWLRSTSSEFAKERIEKTMNVFYKKNVWKSFSSDFLQRSENFCKYMAGHIQNNSGNPGQSQKVMYLFCDYLCQVSLLPTEDQTTYFQNFPPTPEYLKCLDGTEERIEILIRELKSSQTRRPFLRTHEVVTRKIADHLKYFVYEGNQTHIPKYLEYSLGLRQEKVVHPQSQIPFDISWAYHANYSKMFKDRLAIEINPIEDALKFCLEFFPDRRFADFSDKNEDLYKAISAILKPYEINDRSFITESSDAEGFYCIDQKLLEEAVNNIPAVKFLDQFLAQFQDSAQNISLENKAVAEMLLDQAQSLFRKRADNYVVQLLSQDASNEDLLVGVEALWMLGERFANNSSIQFVRIVNALNEIEFNYLDKKIAPRIAKFLPFQVEKIARIKNCYDTHVVNQNVINYLNFSDQQEHPASISTMLAGAAPFEDILQYIENSNDAQTLIENLEIGLQASEIENPDSYYETSISLILRPDSQEIFSALKKKIDQAAEINAVLPTQLVADCLNIAVQINRNDLAKMLLSDFVKVATEIFDNSTVLHKAARNNNSELIRIFAEKNCDPSNYIKLENENGNSPLDIVAMRGSADALKAMIEIGVNKNLIKALYKKTEFSPLYKAAINGSSEIIRIFSDLEVDLGKPSAVIENRKNTAAHLAAINNRDGVIKALGEKISAENLNLKNADHYTPFELAVYHGHVHVMREFRNSGITAEMINETKTILEEPASHTAARRGKDEAIRVLHELSADLNVKNSFGDVPLHRAVSKGHKEAVRALTECEVNLDEKNNDGNSALHLAVVGGNSSIVEILIRAGSNPTLKNNKLLSPIDLAIKQVYENQNANCNETLIALCGWKDSNKNNIIHTLAASKDSTNLIDYFSRKSDLKNLFSEQNNDGNSAIHTAIYAGNHKAVFIMCVNKVVDLDLQNNDGISPFGLLLSKDYRDKELIKDLYENGLDVENIKSAEESDNIMHLAIKNDDVEMAEILKYADVDFNKFLSKNSEGKSPIDLAEEKGEEGKKFIKIFKEVAEKDLKEPRLVRFFKKGNLLLIKCACKDPSELQYRNSNGDTIAHIAVAEKNLDLFKILLEAGVDINAVNNQGETPVDVAADIAPVNFLRLFDLKAKDKNGNSPLHRAILANKPHAVKNIISIDGDGQLNSENAITTPLNLAAKVGSVEIVEFLLSRKSVDINSTDRLGRSARDFAILARDGSNEVMEFLSGKGIVESRVVDRRVVNIGKKSDFVESMRKFSAGLAGKIPPLASAKEAKISQEQSGKPSKSPVIVNDAAVKAVDNDTNEYKPLIP